jgi:hypothetical protein
MRFHVVPIVARRSHKRISPRVLRLSRDQVPLIACPIRKERLQLHVQALIDNPFEYLLKQIADTYSVDAMVSEFHYCSTLARCSVLQRRPIHSSDRISHHSRIRPLAHVLAAPEIPCASEKTIDDIASGEKRSPKLPEALVGAF